MRGTTLMRCAALLLAAAGCMAGPRSPAPAPEEARAEPEAAVRPADWIPSAVPSRVAGLLAPRLSQAPPAAPMPVHCPATVPYMPVVPGEDADPDMPRGPIVPSPCPAAPGSSLALGPGGVERGWFPAPGLRARIRMRSSVPIDSTVRLAPGVEMIVLPNGDTIRRQGKPRP